MKVADKRGVWMTNVSQFRMHDPMTNTFFEQGEPTKAADSQWRQANKAVVPLTDEDGVPVDDPDLITPVSEDNPPAEPAIVELNKGKAK